MEKNTNKINHNSKIGFDDRVMLIVMIPFTAFLIPIVFFDIRFNRAPEYDWNIYLSTLLITTANWLGDRYLLVWARTKYPLFSETKRRLFVQSSVMLFYTFTVTNLLGLIMRPFCDMGIPNLQNHNLSDVLIDSNSAAIFCTLTIVAIYESRYFISELKNSVEEKELFKRESLVAQLSALKTQVNPHFLFNNLNTLCAIIPDSPKLAVAFVQQLSKVYRHILDVKDEQTIDLADELEVIRAYSFLLKTRFGNNLEININVDDNVLKQKIVPLSLQLLMENAIKHNIISTDRQLKIDILSEGSRLIISNNLQRKIESENGTSLGLNNIRSRYQLISTLPVVVTETELCFTVSIPLIKS